MHVKRKWLDGVPTVLGTMVDNRAVPQSRRPPRKAEIQWLDKRMPYASMVRPHVVSIHVMCCFFSRGRATASLHGVYDSLKRVPTSNEALHASLKQKLYASLEN